MRWGGFIEGENPTLRISSGLKVLQNAKVRQAPMARIPHKDTVAEASCRVKPESMSGRTRFRRYPHRRLTRDRRLYDQRPHPRILQGYRQAPVPLMAEEGEGGSRRHADDADGIDFSEHRSRSPVPVTTRSGRPTAQPCLSSDHFPVRRDQADQIGLSPSSSSASTSRSISVIWMRMPSRTTSSSSSSSSSSSGGTP